MEACICASSISVLVNGSPTEGFLVRKGLRQGDPLSPFLLSRDTKLIAFLKFHYCSFLMTQFCWGKGRGRICGVSRKSFVALS